MGATTVGVVVGNPVADEVRHQGQAALRACGGTATYASLALRALGGGAALIGGVGRDFDAMLRAPLAAAGVDLACLRTVGEPSTSYVLEYANPSAERTVRLRHPGPTVRAQDIPPRPPQAGFVHVGAVAGEVSSGALERLAAWGLPMAVDLHVLRRFAPDGAVRLGNAATTGLRFQDFDTIKGSNEEILAFEGGDGDLVQALRAIGLLGVRHVFATDGSRGGGLLAEGELVRVPAYPVSEVDATGAGDVFLAAFLWARHALGEDAREAALFGAAAASFVVQGPGTTTLGDLAGIQARRASLRGA